MVLLRLVLLTGLLCATGVGQIGRSADQGRAASTRTDVVERGWPLSASLFVPFLMAGLSLLALWSLRQRRLNAQRRMTRILHGATEEIITGTTPGEIVRKLSAPVAEALGMSGVGIFTYSRQMQKLDSFYGEGSARGRSESQISNLPTFEAACTALKNRTLLSIPDRHRSTLFGTSTAGPRAALFVPMMTQSDVIGVLELDALEPRNFSDEEQAAVQHLANQIAAALKIQEQQSIREQLFRTEKISSAAQLMSGIANELKMPLEAIVHTAESLRATADSGDPELTSIAMEARRAYEIVQRLLAFSRSEPAEPERVDVNTMVGDVLDLHATRSKAVMLRRHLADHSLVVMGSREQLAQVVGALLFYAERSIARNRAEDARAAGDITVRTALLARSAILEIAWPVKTAESEQDRGLFDVAEKTGLSLEICHGIVQTHGGELRVSRPGGDVRFQIELPVVEAKPRTEPSRESDETPSPTRQLTVLVVEPEAAGQRRVVSVFSGLGHRVVPVASAEEGADLAQRMRFDIAACALRLQGLSWADFLEKVRQHAGAVILMTDTYDANFARTLSSRDVFVLTKPVDNMEIADICEKVADCAASAVAQ